MVGLRKENMSKKISEMTDEELVYFFELWARGRKNVDEIKAEIIRKLKGKP